MAYNNETGLGIISIIMIMIAGYLLTVSNIQYSSIIGLVSLMIGLGIEIKILDKFQFRLYRLERHLGIK